MQAPASDREYLIDPTSPEHKLWLDELPHAEQLVKAGRGDEVLGKEFCTKIGCRINAYRLCSLIAVKYIPPTSKMR